MEFNFPRDYFSKDQFMCFADFSVFLYFDFSISTKIDTTKLLKLHDLHERKKMAEFPYTEIDPHKN